MGVGLGQSYTMSKPTLSFIVKPRDFEWLSSLLPDWGRITTRPKFPDWLRPRVVLRHSVRHDAD
jgi:hypothetical protein